MRTTSSAFCVGAKRAAFLRLVAVFGITVVLLVLGFVLFFVGTIFGFRVFAHIGLVLIFHIFLISFFLKNGGF
jgi:hypothetical protein